MLILIHRLQMAIQIETLSVVDLFQWAVLKEQSPSESSIDAKPAKV